MQHSRSTLKLIGVAARDRAALRADMEPIPPEAGEPLVAASS